MRLRPSVLVAATAALTLLPLPAFAHSVPCQDGPARLASADKPQVEDADGDGTQPWITVLGAGGDIINAWVTGPSAWADRASADKFKATIRFESLERHPFLGRTYFSFEGTGGVTQWVRGESDNQDMAWHFSYGHLEGTTYTTDGTTNGTVDTAAGTISIEIPSSILPPRPANGAAKNLEIVEVESFLRLPANPGVAVGNLQSADLASPTCTAVLYEAAPPA